jgi:hypothetical protein
MAGGEAPTTGARNNHAHSHPGATPDPSRVARTVKTACAIQNGPRKIAAVNPTATPASQRIDASLESRTPVASTATTMAIPSPSANATTSLIGTV